MKGTEKQIKWAEDIINAQRVNINKYVEFNAMALKLVENEESLIDHCREFEQGYLLCEHGVGHEATIENLTRDVKICKYVAYRLEGIITQMDDASQIINNRHRIEGLATKLIDGMWVADHTGNIAQVAPDFEDWKEC